MTNLGLPVPPGFTITTEACRHFLRHGSTPDGLDAEVASHLALIEEAMGRTLGDPVDPLLVSVRSGAKFSMPGMMDTVLNIGLSDDSAARLAPLTSTDADKLISSVRAAPLLRGYRGTPAADLDALRDLLLRFSRLAVDLPEITELDLNPVIARPDGATSSTPGSRSCRASRRTRSCVSSAD